MFSDFGRAIPNGKLTSLDIPAGATNRPQRGDADRHDLDVQRFYIWKSQLKRHGVLAHDLEIPNDIH